MSRFLMAIVVAAILSLSQGTIAQQYPGHLAVRGQNSSGDLTADNLLGERIVLLWPAQDGATHYIVYRAASLNAGWMQVAKQDEKNVRAFGGYEDITGLALTNHLCYKVEAVNEVGQLVRMYESVCVPKFVYRQG